MKKIPNGRQSINEKDLLSVTQALKRDLITTGNLVDDFESKIKNYLNQNMFECAAVELQVFIYLLWL